MTMDFSDIAASGDFAPASVRPPEALPLDADDREQWSSLDSIDSQTAVIDSRGAVRWVNAAWARAANERNGRPVEQLGASFAHVCSRVMGYGPAAAAAARDGLRAVLAGSRTSAEFELVCHPKGGEGWYSVTITPCAVDGQQGALVQHVDMSDVHQAERRRTVARTLARAVGREGARRELLRDVITQVCSAAGWCLAARWSWDRSAQALRCDTVYSLRPDGSRGWAALTNVGGLAARVWNARAPQWSDALDREDAAAARTVLGAQTEQIVEAVGLPMGSDGHAEGVVVFYSTHDHRPDAAFMDMLSSILMGGRWTPSASTREPTDARPRRSRDAVASVIELAASSLCTVLLTGERGTGKARAAREIHLASERARGPYIECDCASMTAHEFERELFGCEPTTLPGADRGRRGLLERSAGGTLVLREVGALDAASQSRLLKVLETHTFCRVGGTRPVTPDVRVITTSSRDLRATAHRKPFSEDLLQRLSSLVVAIAPLRERAPELLDLARSVLADLAHGYVRPAPALAPDAELLLASRAWPGNVRELRNVLDRAWLGVGDEVSSATLATAIASMTDTAALEALATPAPATPALTAPPRAARAHRAVAMRAAQQDPAALLGVIDPTALTLAEVERTHIERVLAHMGFNMRRAAAALDISRSTLYLRLKHYKLDVARSHHGDFTPVENDNDTAEAPLATEDLAAATGT